MDMFAAMSAGLGHILEFDKLLIMIAGTWFGIIVGVIPGLNSIMAIALIVPITYNFETITSLCLLISVFVGALTGGLLSAILLGIPGTPANVATTFDGFPMAKKGLAGRAIGLATFSSVLGGMFSYLCLLFLAPAIADVALKLNSFDIFAIVFCALIMIADASESTLTKGLMSGLFGMLIAMVGIAPIDAALRFTFGTDTLISGFSQTPVLIGLFAVAQVFNEVPNSLLPVPKFENLNDRVIPPWSDFKESIGNFFRASLIGTALGIVPGVGSTTASIMAYNQAKNASDTPEEFGKGTRDGVVASETANNATSGGAMIPLLTLGIPGDPVAALFLSALMIHQIQPGPLLFSQNADIVYSFSFVFIISNFLMFFMLLMSARLFSKFLLIPKSIILPPILIMCVLGSFLIDNRMSEVWSVIGFGVLGFCMVKSGYPLGPLVLGVILGPVAESELRAGLTSTGGSLMPLITTPVPIIFLTLAAIMPFLPAIQNWRRKRRLEKKAA